MVIIMDENGKIIDLCGMNPKAYQKSLENKVLWIMHGDTGRVLPYREAEGDQRITKIEKTSFGYIATLTGESELSRDDVPAKSSPKGNHELYSEPCGEFTIINRLAEVIARRHKEMPEGSYTTHLFNKGPDKIRKKLGEEAVEIILAREKPEIIYESADLIYHLLVLLESLDISVMEVFAELESRE